MLIPFYLRQANSCVNRPSEYFVLRPEAKLVFQLTGLGGDFVDIGCYVNLDVAHGPGQAAGDDALDVGVGPDVVTVAE